MPISLVLAALHPIALEGLQQLLSLEPDFALLAQCGDGAAALAALRRHRPHVLVLDLQMPLKNGLAVLRALRAEPLPSRVVALAAAHDASAREAVRLGARGIVLGDDAARLLVPCIREVAAGGQWLDGQTMTPGLDAGAAHAAAEHAADLLTQRELAVTRLLAQGLRNKQIARQLAIAEGTVKIHLHKIYHKAGVDGRVALTLWAQQKGLL